MSNKVVVLLRWAVILGMPAVVALTSARSLVSPWYPRYEYAKADFPQDPYGLSTDQRLELAEATIDHLNRPGQASEHLDMLTGQRLPDSSHPLYTPAEISHLVDVKDFTNRLWRIYAINTLVVGLSLAVLPLRRATRAAAADALFISGLSASATLLVLAAFVLFGWSAFFTQFHEVFFPAGNWTFDYGSSLIRLFPEKFWFDGGLLLFGGALAAAGSATALGHLLRDKFRYTSVA